MGRAEITAVIMTAMTIMILNINNNNNNSNNITFDEKSYRVYAVTDYAVLSHPVTPELILTLRTRIYIYIHVMNIILLCEHTAYVLRTKQKRTGLT